MSPSARVRALAELELDGKGYVMSWAFNPTLINESKKYNRTFLVILSQLQRVVLVHHFIHHPQVYCLTNFDPFS